MIAKARQAGNPVSVGLLGNAAEVFPELLGRGIRPDVVTDQTSAHDPLNGYLPAGWRVDGAEGMRASDPAAVIKAAKESMALQVQAMLEFPQARHSDRRLRQQYPPDGLETGVADAFDFPGFVPAYIRPLFCRGDRPVPLGGAVGRSGGYLPHRRAGQGADAGR